MSPLSLIGIGEEDTATNDIVFIIHYFSKAVRCIADWRNFLNALNKAKASCETTGISVFDHFVDVNKMIDIGKGGNREV